MARHTVLRHPSSPARRSLPPAEPKQNQYSIEVTGSVVTLHWTNTAVVTMLQFMGHLKAPASTQVVQRGLLRVQGYGSINVVLENRTPVQHSYGGTWCHGARAHTNFILKALLNLLLGASMLDQRAHGHCIPVKYTPSPNISYKLYQSQLLY